MSCACVRGTRCQSKPISYLLLSLCTRNSGVVVLYLIFEDKYLLLFGIGWIKVELDDVGFIDDVGIMKFVLFVP